MSNFPKYHRIPRLYNETFSITEKVDGTNALIYILPLSDVCRYQNVPWLYSDIDGYSIAAGSRSKWITPDDDNRKFAQWVSEHVEQLVSLGRGHHFGEWAGPEIHGNRHQLEEKTLFLFNWRKWAEDHLAACLNVFSLPKELADLNIDVVPVLDPDLPYKFLGNVDEMMTGFLERNGSMVGGKPEGIVVESNLSGQMWKHYCGGPENNATSKWIIDGE